MIVFGYFDRCGIVQANGRGERERERERENGGCVGEIIQFCEDIIITMNIPS